LELRDEKRPINPLQELKGGWGVQLIQN